MAWSQKDIERLQFLQSTLSVSLRFYKVCCMLHFALSSMVQQPGQGSWTGLWGQEWQQSVKPPWWASGATTGCGQALENTQGQKIHVMRNYCFPSNKYRVFLEYICHGVAHNLTLRPHWHGAPLEVVIHLGFPFLVFWCGPFPLLLQVVCKTLWKKIMIKSSSQP